MSSNVPPRTTTSIACGGTPSPSVMSDVFSNTVTVSTSVTLATSARMASTAAAPARRSSCSRRMRSSSSVSASVPRVASAAFVTEFQPLRGVSITVRVPALATTIPGVSASIATDTFAGLPPLFVASAVVTNLADGVPETDATAPAARVTPASRLTVAVTVLLVAAKRSVPDSAAICVWIAPTLVSGSQAV